MSLVNITEAARLAGISRPNFYKNYIRKGKISVGRNERDEPAIDTSDILRVFGKLHTPVKGATKDNTQETPNEAALLERIKGLETLLKAREQELEGYRERERSLLPLLGRPRTHRRWWPFGNQDGT